MRMWEVLFVSMYMCICARARPCACTWAVAPLAWCVHGMQVFGAICPHSSRQMQDAGCLIKERLAHFLGPAVFIQQHTYTRCMQHCPWMAVKVGVHITEFTTAFNFAFTF